MKKIEKTPAEQENQRIYKTLVRDLARNPDTIIFPKEIEPDLAKLSDTIPDSEIQTRRDFRDTPTCTIDPDDAKDFDDALSVYVKPDGNIEVGIHIADVSHFVQPGTHIDTEAIERGTSIYLARRVIPMLPEKLSNNLCSLNEKVDRLTFSVVVTFNKAHKIIDTWYGKGIINSDKRFTYTEAQKNIDTRKGLFAEELQSLLKISKTLFEERKKNGALLLEDTELIFTYDDNNHPIGVTKKERLETHKLIEEFMLLANRLVAELFTDKDLFVYRIHNDPDLEKLEQVRTRASEYKMSLPKKLDTFSLNHFIESIEDADIKSLFSKLIMRSMAKAIYSDKNIGHYGLGFTNYTHFTSPIRRYPDLIAHRLLQKKLLKEKNTDDEATFEKLLTYLSLCEKRAQDMERASQKDMQILYMGTRIGETRIGIVSGMSEYGIYVSDKESLSEGFVGERNLGKQWKWNDRGSFWKSTDDEKIKIGDHIEFKVLKVNFEKGFIDYSLCKKVSKI